MLNLIGLGLRGTKSITLESLEVMKSCDTVYFETYTSVSPEKTVKDLENLIGKRIMAAGRTFIETDDTLVKQSKDQDVCLLVTGDPLSATTHNQLRLDAINQDIRVRIYENSSIMNVIPGILGLMHYRFGPPVSIPFVSSTFFPTSVYDKIERNISMDLHTLLLLDLKDGRTMDIREALSILKALEKKKGKGVLDPRRELCVAIAVCQAGQRIFCGTIESVEASKIEGSPAALVIPARLNDSEQTFLDRFTEKL